MSVAARVAGWERRARNTPGPLAAPQSGSGESPTGLLIVELYLGGWIDITALGLVRYANGVTITSGQPDETSSVNPGSCSMTLDNRDGRFLLRNPLGPYYGVIQRNTPIRVSVQSGNDRSYRFAGEVSAWPGNWDPTGTDIWVDITAAGILRRLQQGKTPLRSSMALNWLNPTTNQGDPAPAPVAYWPMEDAAGATRIASGVGGQPMVISGTPELASYTGFVASNALPSLSDASVRGAIPAYTPGDGTAFEGDGTSETSVVFLLAVSSSGESSQVVCTLGGTGNAQSWEVYYVTGASGALGLRAKDATGVITLDSGVVSAQTIDGKNLLINLLLFEAAGFGFGQISIFDLDAGTSTLANQGVSGVTIGRLTSLTFGPAHTLSDTAVGHAAVFPGQNVVFLDAYTGYSLEGAGNRILRLLNFIGVNSQVRGTETVVMGPQSPSTPLSLIQECVDADLGVLYELPDRVGLGYRTHNTLTNQDVVLALSYPSGELTLVPAPTDDDSYTRNDWTVSRTNGSSSTVQQPDGPLSVQGPPAGVGQYDDSITLNLFNDATLTDQAAWRVHLGTVDEARYLQIAVQLNHPSILNSPTLRRQILAVGMGDRIQITGPFPVPGLDTIDQLVLGVSERVDQFTHQISWNCRPASPWAVAILEDAVLSLSDTDGSQVAVDVSASATSMQVAVMAGPLWTTDPAQFPLDIVVGGERITVGAISGVASPQTFSSLTRSVNGISKPQVPGTDVRLHQPMILAL